MKNIKKIVSATVLCSIFLLNATTVNAESINDSFKHKLSPSTKILKHIPFWLSNNRNNSKDEQLCKIKSKFEYYNFK